LALNGGIRWVSLNEREKAVNERGGKEDMRGKNTRERGLLDFGGEHYFHIGRLYWAFLLLGRLETVLLVFGWRSLL
jgi:hypothetical protein